MGAISITAILLAAGFLVFKHPPAILLRLFSRPEKSNLVSKPPVMVIKEPEHNPEMQTKSKETPEPSSSQRQIPPPPRPPSLNPRPTPSNSMLPPPRPSSLMPPPSAASTLRLPATRPHNTAAFAPSKLTPKSSKPSRQVTLAPGHSPLDWARLTSDPSNTLRGADAGPISSTGLLRVTPSRLKQQTGRRGKDAWSVFRGKVYNISPYLKFHPGGEGELMRAAGKEGGNLFMEVHPWVNWEGMLGECLVGVLVAEGEGDGVGGLEEMD